MRKSKVKNGQRGTANGIRMMCGVKAGRPHYERQPRNQTFEKWERLAGAGDGPICGASMELLEAKLKKLWGTAAQSNDKLSDAP
jgi:hypothetical protein